MYCTKKITPWKNFSFSLHEQDQGALYDLKQAYVDGIPKLKLKRYSFDPIMFF